MVTRPFSQLCLCVSGAPLPRLGQTWEKKKVLHKLSIPLQLDMGQVLYDAALPLPEAAPRGHDGALVLPGSPNSCYELVAVLIHKGTSASHGHYGEGAANTSQNSILLALTRVDNRVD